MCTSPFSPKKNAPKYEMLFFPHLKNRFSFSSVKINNGHFEKRPNKAIRTNYSKTVYNINFEIYIH